MADLAELLLQLGIDHRAEDGNGMTALHLAAWLNEDAVVSLLMDGTTGNNRVLRVMSQHSNSTSKEQFRPPAAAGPAANNAPCVYAEMVHELASDTRVRLHNLTAQSNIPGPYSHAAAC